METFDTYTKHSAVYKLFNINAIIFFVLIVLLFIGNKKIKFLSNSWQILLFIILFLSVIIFVVGMVLRNIQSAIPMYIKDGELALFENQKLSWNSIAYCIEGCKVEIKIIGYRGQGGSKGGKDGTGNTIKIYNDSKMIFQKKFVLKNKEQLDRLKSMIFNWKNSNTSKLIIKPSM